MAAATVAALRALGIRVNDVAMATVDIVAPILVMDVAAATVVGIASRQGDHRRFPREVASTTVLERCLGAACASLDAHRHATDS